MNKKIGKRGFLGQRVLILPNSIQESLSKNTITKPFFITDIGFYPRAEGHFIHRNQGSKEYIFIYCVEGSGRIAFENQNLHLQPNSFCLIPIATKHEYEATKNDPWSIYWMHFKGHLCPSLYERHLEVNEYAQKISFDSERIAMFDRIFQMLSNEYAPQQLEFANILGLHFLSSFIYLSVDGLNTHSKSNLIENITAYLDQNLDSTLKTEDIAQKFNYSTSYVLNLFKKHTGYSLIQFFNLKKMQKACEYLKYSDLSIKEISFKLGFQDPFYFSRIFKKTIGQSPSEYREEV